MKLFDNTVKSFFRAYVIINVYTVRNNLYVGIYIFLISYVYVNIYFIFLTDNNKEVYYHLLLIILSLREKTFLFKYKTREEPKDEAS